MFGNVGRNKIELDQEDRVAAYDLFWDFNRRIEDEPVYNRIDDKNEYLCPRTEFMSDPKEIKDFTVIALKSPASDFAKYQPPIAELNPDYIQTSIAVKKRDFLETFAQTWAQGRYGKHNKKNGYKLFGWFFVGHLFPTEAITEDGYPAWLPLKDVLDIPNIKDFSNFGPGEVEAFRVRFYKEGEIYENKRRQKIEELAQEVIHWAVKVAEGRVCWKPENIWCAESLPYIRPHLFKEFEAENTVTAAIDEAWTVLRSYIGRSQPNTGLGVWPRAVPPHEAYYDSNGESEGLRKRKREIEEERAQLKPVRREETKSDPDLFDNEPPTKANKAD